MCDSQDMFDDEDPEAFPFIGEPDEIESPTWQGKFEIALGMSDD